MDAADAALDPLTIPTVRCDQGHRLGGLFVILRPSQAPDSMLLELFGTLDNPFVLGFTNALGHLQLCGDEDPWPDFYAPQLAPHALKVLPYQAYDMYLVRHPDPALARRALDELNGHAKPDVTLPWQPAQRRFTVETARAPDGAEVQSLVLVLDEQPGSYWPQGSQRYGGWTLYADMPHRECAAVRKQVLALQHELGRMRFIVGDGNRPYLPECEARNKKGQVTNPATANEGCFDARTLNAVLHFQQSAAAGAGRVVVDRDPSFGQASAMVSRPPSDPGEPMEASLAYLAIHPDVQPAPEPLREDGVVDAATGTAVTRWLAQGVRSASRLLVQMPARDKLNPEWRVWVGEEAARSLHAWRVLTQALGFEPGIQANATYRGVLVDVGHAAYGRSARSIHKVSLAIDTGLKGNYHEVDELWPIFYTRDGEPKPAHDDRGRVIGHRYHWRLYAPSRLDLASQPGLQECEQALRAATQDVHPLAGPLLHQEAQALLDELGRDPAAFVAKHFADQVCPWQYDAWDDEGGQPGAPLNSRQAGKPACARLDQQDQALAEQADTLKQELQQLDQQPRPWTTAQNKERYRKNATLKKLNNQRTELQRRRQLQQGFQAGSGFIDLTALAQRVGLARIGSFTNRRRPTGTDWGLAAQAYGTKGFKALAGALAQAARNMPTLSFDCQGREVPFGEVDPVFLQQWADAWPDLKLGPGEAPLARCSLTREPAGQLRVQQVCNALANFPDRIFRHLQTGQRQTGRAWADEIRRRQAELLAAAPVKKTDASQASQAKQRQAWLYPLQPDFGRRAEGPVELAPGSVVYLPAAGSPIGMEWWHFQRSDLIEGKAYGEMLQALGFLRITTLDQRAPQLYHRMGMGYPEKELNAPAA